MQRFKLSAAALLATILLVLVFVQGRTPVSALEHRDDDGSIFTQTVQFGDAQVTPDGYNVRAFVPTGSLNTNCLATLSESNNAIPGIVVFCAPREFNNQKGVLFSAFFPQPIPAGLVLSATIYQQHAREYGPPVFYPGI
jgi:hypothetical protein